MAITLRQVLLGIDDERMDSTPGTVDTNIQGLRAVNSFLDYMFNTHEWPGCLEETVIKYYRNVVRYPLPARYYYPSSVNPIESYFDNFRLKTPTVLVNRWKNGTRDNMMAYEMSRTPRIWMYYPSSRSLWTSFADCSSTSATGWTWTTDTGSLVTEPAFTGKTLNHLKLKLTTSGTATLKAVTATPMDLTYYNELGKLFQEIQIGDGITLTGVTFRIGSSDTDYYEGTTTVQQDALPFETGTFNVCGSELSGMAAAGTPDITAIDRLSLILTYTVATGDKSIRLLSSFISNAELINHRYYSYSMVKDAVTGALSLHFDGLDLDDTLTLPDESLTTLVKGATWKLLQQMDKRELADLRRIESIGQSGNSGLLGQLKGKYPSLKKEPEGPQFILQSRLGGSNYFRGYPG